MKAGSPYFIAIILSAMIVPYRLSAQDNNAPSSKDPHELRITGYLQTQYQKAAAPGITSFSGGDFSPNSSERFMIRRGRLKIDRVDKFTNIVFQIDATQNGVQLMDAFIQLHEPSKRAFLFTAGLFNKPFGHSVVYSSGYRDFPERARVFQTILPRERDIGAMVGFHPAGAASFLTAEVAVVNGSGLNARDYDSRKDIIGNLSFKFDSLAGNKVHLGFGASIYKGHVRNNTTTVYSSTSAGFSPSLMPANLGSYIKRDYFGINLQLQFDHSFGPTQLKAEYVSGTQPGVADSPSISGPTASVSFGSQPATDLFRRKFNGYYIWLTQATGIKGLNALAAFDVYDPNIKLENRQLGGAGSFTSAADVKYATFGAGLAWSLNNQIKFTAYYEDVKNSGTQITNFTKDIKDNVFTARLQYRW